MKKNKKRKEKMVEEKYELFKKLRINFSLVFSAIDLGLLIYFIVFLVTKIIVNYSNKSLLTQKQINVFHLILLIAVIFNIICLIIIKSILRKNENKYLTQKIKKHSEMYISVLNIPLNVTKDHTCPVCDQLIIDEEVCPKCKQLLNNKSSELLSSKQGRKVIKTFDDCFSSLEV